MSRKIRAFSIVVGTGGGVVGGPRYLYVDTAAVIALYLFLSLSPFPPLCLSLSLAFSREIRHLPIAVVRNS